MYGHYLFTPRELTNWCLSLLRYNLNDLKDNNSVEPLLEIWAYEARQQFDTIISNVLQDDWRTTIKLKGLTFIFQIMKYLISL
jgi:dynein heavy chain 2